jgi:hypothetical protein
MNTVKKLDYVLGSAQRELERLITQSRILQPITERLMRQAGLSQGQLQMHKFFAFRAGGVEANTASSKPQRSSIYIRGISVVQIKKEKISERGN